jgi:hypothetical protein
LDEGLSNPRNSAQKRKQVSAHLRLSFSIVEKTVGEAAGGVCTTINKSTKGGITMSYPVRVADRLLKQSADQLISMAGAIITGLTNNPAFPAPTVDLKDVQDAVESLKTALAEQPHGGVAATAEKNNKKEALIALLRKLKHYVEDNCGNDLAVLLSSGFQAALSDRARLPLANPSILSINFGNSTELVLKVTPIARAKCYEVRSAAVGADGVPGNWQAAGLFTSSRLMTIPGLAPGKTYTFQVRGIGGSTGYSDWSNPVSRMCA